LTEDLHTDSSGKFYRRAIIIVTVVAAGLRLYRIDQGFWYDELFSLQNFFNAGWMKLFTEMPDPNHHPLYSVLAKISITALGEKEWTARLPAFLFGAATPPLVYLFGARSLNRSAGLIAALLLSFNMWHIYLSQDARGYSAAVFFVLFSTYFFMLLLEKITIARVAAYVLLSSTAMYFHLYTFAAPVGHLLMAGIYLAVNRSKWKSSVFIPLAPVFALLLAGLIYFPMFDDMLRFARTEGQIIGTREFNFYFIKGLFYSWASGADSFWLSLPLIIISLAGFVLGVKKRPWFVLAWVLPLLVALLVPLFTDTFVYHRFYTFLMPGFFLVSGYGVARLLHLAKAPSLSWLPVGIVLVVFMVPAVHEYHTLGKQGLKEAAEWIEDNAPEKKALAIGLAREQFRYYIPHAVTLEKNVILDERWLSDSVVVYAFPWSVKRENKIRLENGCGKPIVFKSAGYDENVVRLYRCY